MYGRLPWEKTFYPKPKLWLGFLHMIEPGFRFKNLRFDILKIDMRRYESEESGGTDLGRARLHLP